MNTSFGRRIVAHRQFPSLCARLRLVCRIAAFHRERGWPSLVLHWRRKRIRRSNSGWRCETRWGTLPVQLHVNSVYRMTALALQTQVTSLPPTTFAPPIGSTLLHRIHRASEIRSESRSVGSPSSVGRMPSVERIPVQSSFPFLPSLWPAKAAQISFRKLYTSLERTRTVSLVGSERIDRLRTFQAHTTTRYHERDILHLRRLQAGGTIAESVTHSPTSLAFVRTPELVWRKAQEQSINAAQSQSSTNNTSLNAMSPEQSREQKQTISLDTPSTQRTDVQAANLDPRLVDRLADDVIQRVERRIRIERERRGLL